MPSYSDFHIAIYEKEPTSLIAYALTSRHYARELKFLREKKATPTGGGTGIGSTGSPKL